MHEPSTLERPVSEAHQVRQGQRTASRVIDGKAVVITIDRNELHVLNAVGTRVWELSDGRSLEDIIESADGPLFNNAAQVWNHTFYWSCMAPGGGGERLRVGRDTE